MLRLEKLVKHFGQTVAVADVSLHVREGEFLTLLGPSGCGKTTTLRMIAGFETPTAGRILLDGRDIARLSPQRRGFGMVFQSYALFPHLDVFENVAFGLKTRGAGRDEIRSRVEESLALVDLSGYADRKVQQLSGGQQQRVALARALAPEPAILLLDEPLSNLDAALRERTRTELRTLIERLGITAIFVTHDQEEAFALSDRIAVMRDGLIQQTDAPEALYQRPATPFVAQFLGRANFLDAEVAGADGDELVCTLPGGARWRVGKGATLQPGDAARVMVRPEALRIHLARSVRHAGTTVTPTGALTERPGADTATTRDVASNAADPISGTVLERRFAGPVTHYHVRVGDTEITVHGGAEDAEPGDEVVVRLVRSALAYEG